MVTEKERHNPNRYKAIAAAVREATDCRPHSVEWFAEKTGFSVEEMLHFLKIRIEKDRCRWHGMYVERTGKKSFQVWKASRSQIDPKILLEKIEPYLNCLDKFGTYLPGSLLIVPSVIRQQVFLIKETIEKIAE